MAHILFIDDDPLFSEIQVKILGQEGHLVTTAENGVEAMKVLRQIEPDLIITDILMPEMDGVGIISELSLRDNETPIIAISGGRRSLSAKFNLESAALLGAKVTLTKPFSRKELRDAIEQALK
jgi:CheY-like chemotaxis protein